METARWEPRLIHRSLHGALARGDPRVVQRAGARDLAAVSGRQAEGTRALRQRLIAKKPMPVAASAAAPPPAASGTLLPPLRLPPPPVLAPPAGGNPATVESEECVAEGTTAARIVAEGLGAGAVGDGVGLCMHVHVGLGAGVAGGWSRWWCLHPHVEVGSGVVVDSAADGVVGDGVVGAGVLVAA